VPTGVGGFWNGGEYPDDAGISARVGHAGDKVFIPSRCTVDLGPTLRASLTTPKLQHLMVAVASIWAADFVDLFDPDDAWSTDVAIGQPRPSPILVLGPARASQGAGVRVGEVVGLPDGYALFRLAGWSPATPRPHDADAARRLWRDLDVLGAMTPLDAARRRERPRLD
jgi:hypothetical protein